jgi:hypothetical protein
VEVASSLAGRILVGSLLLVAAWTGLVAWREHRISAAVSALPFAMQEQMYRRTYDELTSVCAAQPALAAHCRDEASLIVRLPQCGDDCQTLARRYFTVATK